MINVNMPGKKKKSRNPEKTPVEFEVEEIIDVEFMKNGKRKFLVKWKGFSTEEATWEPEVNLNCNDLVQKYFDKIGKAKNKSNQQENPSKTKWTSSRSRSLKKSDDNCGDSADSKNEDGGKRNATEPENENTEIYHGRSSRSRVTINFSTFKTNECSMLDIKSKIHDQPSKIVSEKSASGNETLDSDSSDSEDVPLSSLRINKRKNSTSPGRCKSKKNKKSCISKSRKVGKSQVQNGKSQKSYQNKENIEENRNEEGGEGSDRSTEYEVEKIVDVHYLKNGGRLFLIKWKGYSSKYNSWEPQENLNCNDMLEQFLKKVEKLRSAPVKELRFNRKPTDRFTIPFHRHQRKLSNRIERLPRISYAEVDYIM